MTPKPILRAWVSPLKSRFRNLHVYSAFALDAYVSRLTWCPRGPCPHRLIRSLPSQWTLSREVATLILQSFSQKLGIILDLPITYRPSTHPHTRRLCLHSASPLPATGRTRVALDHCAVMFLWITTIPAASTFGPTVFVMWRPSARVTPLLRSHQTAALDHSPHLRRVHRALVHAAPPAVWTPGFSVTALGMPTLGTFTPATPATCNTRPVLPPPLPS